jgi:hypothetical protein
MSRNTIRNIGQASTLLAQAMVLAKGIVAALTRGEVVFAPSTQRPVSRPPIDP